MSFKDIKFNALVRIMPPL